MKKWMKKAGLVAASAAALTTLVSAGPANADASRVIYFSVQSNVTCGDVSPTNQYINLFNFNVSNISDTPVNITLKLYKKDGTLYTGVGATGYGVASDITPGAPVTIGANATVQFYQNYGYSSVNSCSERPAYGTVVVNSNSGQLLANGEFQALRWLANAVPNHWESYAGSTIVVNAGQPF